MEKIKYLLATMIILILSFNLKAQIELEHTFNSESYIQIFYTENDMKYYDWDILTYNITIYNSDYSIYKIINMNANIDEYAENFNIQCLSDKLFNNDNLIEFTFGISYHDDTNGIYYHSLKLFNENNEILKDFGDMQSAYIVSYNNISKLLLIGDELSYIKTEIYSLPGNPYTKNYEEKNIINNAYPNPSDLRIILPYHLEQGTNTIMNIYNLNGQIIEQKRIDSNFDKINLNIENYKNGIYFYEYNGITNKFIKN